MTIFKWNWQESKWNASLSNGGLFIARESTAWLEMPVIVWLLQLRCPQTVQAMQPSKRAHLPVPTSCGHRGKWIKGLLRRAEQELSKHVVQCQSLPRLWLLLSARDCSAFPFISFLNAIFNWSYIILSLL